MSRDKHYTLRLKKSSHL